LRKEAQGKSLRPSRRRGDQGAFGIVRRLGFMRLFASWGLQLHAV
jgi:hypothetical protein